MYHIPKVTSFCRPHLRTPPVSPPLSVACLVIQAPIHSRLDGHLTLLTGVLPWPVLTQYQVIFLQLSSGPSVSQLTPQGLRHQTSNHQQWQQCLSQPGRGTDLEPLSAAPRRASCPGCSGLLCCTHFPALTHSSFCLLLFCSLFGKFWFPP